MVRVLLILLVLTSCNPQKKLQRLVKKHPELIQKDTLTVKDTLTMITHRVETDTVTSLKEITHDTLIITKENLTVKTIYNYQTDSIYISGKCDSDTIQVPYEVKVPVEKVVIQKQNNLKQIIIILGLLTLIVIFAKRLR